MLIVDDNEGDLELARLAFDSVGVGADVQTVNGGEAALRYLNDQAATPPAVVLLDLNMPGTGGLDVLRALRANKNLCRLPVVMYTTSNAERDVADSYRLGANAYLVKPASFDACVDLLAVVARFWTTLNMPSQHA